MHTVDKHVALMASLAEKTTLLQRMQRLNIEQKSAPHFRTYIAVGAEMSKEELRTIEDIAESLTLNANVFRAGTQVSAITFTDMDERRSAQ